jgi:nicotinamide/nicotinate riboside kinase
MPAFVNAMRYIRQNDGKFPPTLDSKEDQNELGQSGVPDHVVQIMQNEVVAQGLVSHRDTEIVVTFVDGFLLYNDPSVVKELDMSLLVRAPYEKLKARREARSGYVTLEGIPSHTELTSGFWEDPPGYFDNIVWKWYVKDHQHLFENGDVSGALLQDKVLSLQTPAQLDLNMQELLVWAMGSLSNYLENID